MSVHARPLPASTASIPSLDGIRAIAVTLVFLAHSGLEQHIPGGLGVTIFFVLSGFLITTLLRIEQARNGGISFSAFYLRRVLRLMPPLLLVVLGAVLLARFGVIGGEVSGAGVLATLLYLGNYYVIANDFAGLPSGLAVVWSLAVEEHYYLFYPPLAALLLRRGRTGFAAAVLLLLSLAVLAWRCVLAQWGVSEDYIGMASDTRIDAILAGCLLALWRNPWLEPPAVQHPLRDAALAAGCVALLLGTLLYREPLFRMTLRYTLQALAIAPLLYLAVARAGQWPFRWLNARPLVWLGTVSYTVYLVHHLVLLGIARQAPALGWIATAVLGALLTLLLAEAMRRGVEKPCAELRRRLHRDVVPPSARAAPLPARAQPQGSA